MEMFGLKNGEERVVKIGKTFQEGNNEFYHTLRYDFKPASADNQKCGSVIVEEKEVQVTVPLVEGHGAQEAVYRGSKTPASKDYMLVVDHNTGEITLERVGYHIRVKRTRVEKKYQGHRLSPIEKQSPSQGYSASGNSPNKPSPRQSPSTNRPSTQKTPTPQIAAPSSMPLLSLSAEDNKYAMAKQGTAEFVTVQNHTYNHSIMSDSSSDSDSNSGSSSSSYSDSESESETMPDVSHPKGMPDIKMRNGYNSPNILDDLNLSEED